MKNMKLVKNIRVKGRKNPYGSKTNTLWAVGEVNPEWVQKCYQKV